MNVLVTGATGYIGSAIGSALVHAGHEAHALVRSDEARARVRQRGWMPVRGDLRHADYLQVIAADFDAIIHTANTGSDDAEGADERATRAFLRGLAGSGKPFVYTSGAWVLGEGDTDEDSAADPTPLVAWRGMLEAEVLGSAPGVRTVVVRPGIVYGHNGGIVGMIARGELPVVGDGRQAWPQVHVDDLARLYVQALSAPGGAILHGVAHTSSMIDLALAAGAGRPAHIVPPLTLADARTRYGAFADALALDQRVSSRRTRALLGWRPSAPSAIEELLVASHMQQQATAGPGRAPAAAYGEVS
jgi:nucleoside-diphosphate-sugar epimerase